MLRSKFVLTTLAVAALIFGVEVPGEQALHRVQAVGAASEPCAHGSSELTAPKNLRIILTGALEASRHLFQAVAWAAPATSGASPHAYFDTLTLRPDCLTSFHYRNQANIDALRSRSENDRKIPIVYDAAHDAAKFEIDPSASLPNSGATGTPQKHVPIAAPGASSLLITWDLKIAESMRYVPKDGLTQHKSHRLDDPSASGWVGMKQNYSRATNQGKGIAMFFFSSGLQMMGQGTMLGSSSTISRIGADGKAIMPPEFYIQPDTWTRVWVFLEGDVSARSAPVQMSVWLADEHSGIVQLYDRINLITPDHDRGVGIFRFEFDSSTKEASNGPGQQWQRNFVALRGTPRAEVLTLIQKPVN